MFKSTYRIAQMDCPSEENLIRMKLQGLDTIVQLEFDLDSRRLVVVHSEGAEEIERRLNELNLGSRLQESVATEWVGAEENSGTQAKLLWYVLFINLGFFFLEITTGWLSKSMGLIADSLDMLADAIVYGLSLWATGASSHRKAGVATASGYFQILLATIGLIEVVRRFIGFEELPDFRMMIVISILALTANSFCLYLLQQDRSDESHMKASMIFTSNDVIINIGVICAGVLVLLTGSRFPDLIIGGVVFVIVVIGAFRILKLAR